MSQIGSFHLILSASHYKNMKLSKETGQSSDHFQWNVFYLQTHLNNDLSKHKKGPNSRNEQMLFLRITSNLATNPF